MSEGSEEIALRLGTGFAAMVKQFLPAGTEAVSRTGKDVSFGATVKVRSEHGIIVGKLIPHEPKIPTEPMDAIPFILQVSKAGQLEFLVAGTIDELKEEVNTNAEPAEKGYTPEGSG